MYNNKIDKYGIKRIYISILISGRGIRFTWETLISRLNEFLPGFPIDSFPDSEV